MSTIHVLSEHIANQIAAGEVVERPSSVVKELIENSIDAGSTKIDVTIEEGGLQLIRVQDNGAGIPSDDCEKAFYRHATSKIRAGKDLFQIRSLGFRGEALPSISAVSRMECLTSARTDGLGKRIIIEGGKLVSNEEAGSSRGTDITVRDLFFNTPARLKYMKTIQTELGHISDFMYRLALAHPQISFTLRHNGNQLLQTLGNNDMLQVIAAVYGSAVAKSMIEIKGESLDYTLQGFIAKPEVTRANRYGISTIINGRYIRNFALAKSILNAYHTLLPINRYPVAVLKLEMEPSLVDVNVHPAKLEVRFSKEKELMQFVEQELKKVLHGQTLIPKASLTSRGTAVIQEKLEFAEAKEKQEHQVQGHSAQRTQSSSDIRSDDSTKPFPSSSNSVRSAQGFLNQPTYEQPQRSTEARSSSPASYTRQSSSQKAERPGAGQIKEALEHFAQHNEDSEQRQAPKFPELYPIGQMRGTYIIAQNEDGLYLIDQHAAHERINYEYYYEKFGNPAPVSQELLVPINLEFTPSEAEQLKNRLHLFEQAGVYIEHFGGSSFIVRSYPHWLPEGEEKSTIEEMAEWILSEKQSIDVAKLREQSSILCSCKASIKANQSLSDAEVRSLLKSLAQSSNPFTCPHGRPIVISFSNYELEKMFKRA